MYFSVTFGTEPDIRNTWEDWRLIPATPPMIMPPSPNLNLVDIPGRRQGPIDMSKYPFGYITYQRISGSWTFLYEPKSHQDRVDHYESIRRWLHGRTCIARLEEDPGHYYRGVFTVGAPSTGQGPNQIDIQFSLEPLRYNVKDNTEDTTWVSSWNT